MGNDVSQLWRGMNEGNEISTIALLMESEELKSLNPNTPFTFGYPNNTPLHMAAKLGMVHVLRYFLDGCAGNPTLKNDSGKNCLHLVCEKKKPAGNKGPLHHITSSERKRRVLCAKLLLDWRGELAGVEKIDTGAQDTHGNTALHLAIESEFEELAKLLVAHGTPILAANKSNLKPADIAIQKKNNRLADYLFEAEMNVDSFTLTEEVNKNQEKKEQLTEQDIEDSKAFSIEDMSELYSLDPLLTKGLLEGHGWSVKSFKRCYESDSSNCKSRCFVASHEKQEETHGEGTDEDSQKCAVKSWSGDLDGSSGEEETYLKLRDESDDSDDSLDSLEADDLYDDGTGVISDSVKEAQVLACFRIKQDYTQALGKLKDFFPYWSKLKVQVVLDTLVRAKLRAGIEADTINLVSLATEHISSFASESCEESHEMQKLKRGLEDKTSHDDVKKRKLLAIRVTTTTAVTSSPSTSTASTTPPAVPEKSDDPAAKQITPENSLKPRLVVFIDTCSFMREMARIKKFMEEAQNDNLKRTVIIPWRVMQEIDNIKDRKSEDDAPSKALAAAQFLHSFIEARSTLLIVQSPRKALKAERYLIPQFDSKRKCQDDSLLRCYLYFWERYHTTHHFLLITEDTHLRSKAISMKFNATKIKSIKKTLLEMQEHPDRRVEKKVYTSKYEGVPFPDVIDGFLHKTVSFTKECKDFLTLDQVKSSHVIVRAQVEDVISRLRKLKKILERLMTPLSPEEKTSVAQELKDVFRKFFLGPYSVEIESFDEFLGSAERRSTVLHWLMISSCLTEDLALVLKYLLSEST